MTESPSRHYSEHCKATEELGDAGKRIWRNKCGPSASDTAGERWR